jgi:hypothetical protein
MIWIWEMMMRLKQLLKRRLRQLKLRVIVWIPNEMNYRKPRKID